MRLVAKGKWSIHVGKVCVPGSDWWMGTSLVILEATSFIRRCLLRAMYISLVTAEPNLCLEIDWISRIERPKSIAAKPIAEIRRE